MGIYILRVTPFVSLKHEEVNMGPTILKPEPHILDQNLTTGFFSCTDLGSPGGHERRWLHTLAQVAQNGFQSPTVGIRTCGRHRQGKELLDQAEDWLNQLQKEDHAFLTLFVVTVVPQAAKTAVEDQY